MQRVSQQRKREIDVQHRVVACRERVGPGKPIAQPRDLVPHRAESVLVTCCDAHQQLTAGRQRRCLSPCETVLTMVVEGADEVGQGGFAAARRSSTLA